MRGKGAYYRKMSDFKGGLLIEEGFIEGKGLIETLLRYHGF